MSREYPKYLKAAAVLVALLVLATCVAGCQSDGTALVTPTPPKTARPTFTSRPLIPTVTNTPAPSATMTPTQEATVTATPTPTPTLEVALDLEATVTPWPTLAPDVCPLTGLVVSDLALLDRRPLAIKVQNAALSRPQFGLPQADIVYEHLAEAGITRFTAIYLCQEVLKVGSTRSARFIDLEIPAMYKSLIAFSGTSPGLFPKFTNADFKEREFWYDRGINSSGFYRDRELRESGVPIEHTLFADPVRIWEIADELGISEPQDLQDMSFDDAVPEDGEAANFIHIPYPNRQMVVDYRYDPDRGVYLRWDGGDPHLDAATGEQIAVTNVVLAYANHVDADFYEDYPRTNHPSVQIQLWGTGPAVIFRDGMVFEGLWARPQREDMLVFRDAAGQVPIPLKPGNTWIQLIPLEGHRWTFEATWEAVQ